MPIRVATPLRVQPSIKALAILSKMTTISYHTVDCLGPAGLPIIRYGGIFIFAIIVDLLNSVGHLRCKFSRSFVINVVALTVVRYFLG
jgi:hypothetical protein